MDETPYKDPFLLIQNLIKDFLYVKTCRILF